MEFRIKDVNLEVDTRGIQRIGGYINVTERESEMLFSQQRGKWFKETMQKGVFQRSIAKSQSIPLLLEHDWDKEIANTTNGTLELREDNIGLRFDATIDDSQLYEEIRSGKINSCSFGFKVNDQEYQEVNSRLEKRYVKDITLLECSLVKNPAYVGSLVESRNLENALKMDKEMIQETQVVNEEVVEETTIEETSETNSTVEENTIVEETTQEEVVVEEEVSSAVDVEEERTIDVDMTSSDVKNEAKEVIQEVIDQKEQQLELTKITEEIIEDIKVEEQAMHEEEMQRLDQDAFECATQALKLQIELLKLKELKMKL
ncbi:HK97 family phage prohead protease [Terrisporobacter sp.]|uniref:HK97 family phage prohead protease n=1 Tax=Terrisporobacter sp. TaxID=1965305 RepID=UPI00399217B1